MTKNTTVVKAAEHFITRLEQLGKKPSTVGTARRTLDLLIADLGSEKIVGKILPVHISKFFGSEAATMQEGKNGPRPRAQASVLQIRRIVRQLLIFCTAQGYVEKTPLPKSESEKKGGVRLPKDTAAENQETPAGEPADAPDAE